MPPHVVTKELSIQPSPLHRPLLTTCSSPGCATLTMGGTCVEHDAPVLVEFPRGRPYLATARETRLLDVAS